MTITNQQLAAALQQVLAIANALDTSTPQLQALKAAATNFATVATSALPANPDGSPISDVQLDAMADGNHSLAQQIIADVIAADPTLAPPAVPPATTSAKT